MPDRLPLFPLGTVLVPGLVLPLHVFEPRYRQLVADLQDLPEDERQFGVVAIRAGREVGSDGAQALYDVGCAAVVRQLTSYDDGRSDLVTTGGRRFRLLDLDRDSGTPYLTGLVEWLEEDDDDEPGTQDTALRVHALWQRYTELLGAQAPQLSGGIPDEPSTLSYLVTTALLLPIGERQSLLAAPTTGARLTAARRLLRREISLIQAVPSLPLLDPDQLRASIRPPGRQRP